MTETPVNWKKGIKYYGGDEDMFKLMIESFENLPFNNYMKQLHEHVSSLDYQAIRIDAYSIKKVSITIAAEKCQQCAIELENGAMEEDESKVIDKYILLLKESRALKTYIANATNKKFNAQDFEKYEREISRRYNRKLSANFPHADTQRQNSTISNHPVSKKSLYSEPHKLEAKNVSQPNPPNIDQQQQRECVFESPPTQKQQPVCCTVCTAF